MRLYFKGGMYFWKLEWLGLSGWREGEGAWKDEWLRYNQVCSGDLASGFAQGYDEGRAVYEIYREHKRLIGQYEDTLEALINVRGRLAGDIVDEDDEGNIIPLSESERKRLIKKQYRLEGELDDLRQDVRGFEYDNNLPRHKF